MNLDGCLWELKDQWVCADGVVNVGAPVPSLEHTEFIQVPDAPDFLVTEVGRILCAPDPVLYVLVALTLMFVIVGVVVSLTRR